MSSNLRVLVASGDRSLLRQSALLLTQFGYEPICCADVAFALRSRIAGDCGFLIVDEDTLAGDYDQIEYAKRRRDAEHLQVYLLCSDLDRLDIDAAIESGVDDFLRKPLSNGEVLARLRAGARYGEFQRRNCRQQWHDPLTGLATKTALLEHIAKQTSRRGRSRNVTVAVVELDLFDNLAASYGLDTGNEVLCSVAQLIQQQCNAGQVAARLAGGRFAVLLADHSVEKASKWAEQARHSISSMELAKLDPVSRITVSVGLAAGDEHLTPEKLLERALAALNEAHCCGRNCLAIYGEFEDERNAWQALIQSGNPFQSTVARDVMTPFTLTLGAEDSLSSVAAMFEQTKLDWLPVLDARGHWAGIVEGRTVAEDSQGDADSTPVSQAMCSDVAELPAAAAFSSVMDCFVRQDEPVVVIAHNGRPEGFIAREQFLALVRPMSADMFAWSEAEVGRGTEFLVVPDAVAL